MNTTPMPLFTTPLTRSARLWREGQISKTAFHQPLSYESLGYWPRAEATYQALSRGLLSEPHFD